MIDQPIVHRVTRITEEARNTITIWLEGTIECAPGRFVMVWVPRIGEKPYAVSYLEENEFGITVSKRGHFSSALHSVKAGDAIGVRGPYGRGFELRDKGCIVAGGVGVAMVALLKEQHPEYPLINGAQSKDELVFAERFPDMRICTDDGSAGCKGFPTDLLADTIRESDCECVYTCGPEVMMKKVFDICEEQGVECQATLERYMKCGFGVCGQCSCDGLLVCRDGPVFGSETLRTLSEFGRWAYLKNGSKVSVQEYAAWRHTSGGRL